MNNGALTLHKGEEIKVTYTDSSSNVLFAMTYSWIECRYTLYELVEGKMKKLGCCENPIKLEQKYHVYSRMNHS